MAGWPQCSARSSLLGVLSSIEVFSALSLRRRMSVIQSRSLPVAGVLSNSSLSRLSIESTPRALSRCRMIIVCMTCPLPGWSLLLGCTITARLAPRLTKVTSVTAVSQKSSVIKRGRQPGMISDTDEGRIFRDGCIRSGAPSYGHPPDLYATH